ncbi:MAG: YidC/Oxa1 family membrane protein insertase [Aristaeellaceae bacterium]
MLPVLSCVTQILMTKLTQNKNQQNAANGNMAMMNLVMPLFSLVICLGYNSSFALYWVVSNCFAILQTIVLNRILDKKTVTQE